jgi:hypothetical protein
MQDQVGTFNIRTPTGGVAVTASTPLTLVQYAASSTNAAELLFFSVGQTGSTTSAQEHVRVIRKTAGATVTIGAVGTNIFDATHNSSGGQAFLGTLSTSATGVTGTAEGTDGDEWDRRCFNVLAGYEKDYQPNARLWVPPSGIIAIKMGAIVSLTWHCTMTIREMRC